MKAWEKHQYDLYVLANDILENLYHQEHGYKSIFYYDFNAKLNFLQSDGSRQAQMKLLKQLANKGAFAFVLKTPSQSTTQEMLSRNVNLESAHKELIHLHIRPEVFNKVYKELLAYSVLGAEPSKPEESLTLQLRKPDNRLLLTVSGETEEYILKKFRPGLPPDEIFSWLVNRAPDTKVTRTLFETEAGIRTSRKLNEIVDKSLPPVVRQTFVVVSAPDALQIKVNALVRQPTLGLILTEID